MLIVVMLNVLAPSPISYFFLGRAQSGKRQRLNNVNTSHKKLLLSEKYIVFKRRHDILQRQNIVMLSVVMLSVAFYLLLR
jgi:hypothetical protein